MSNDSTFVRYRRPESGARPSPEDLEYHRNLTEAEIHAAALSDPDCPPLTPERLAQMRPLPLARVARWRTGLSRNEFAETFGFTLEQVEVFEAGTAKPDQAIVSYLKIIQARPEQVLAMLADLRAGKAP